MQYTIYMTDRDTDRDRDRDRDTDTDTDTDSEHWAFVPVLHSQKKNLRAIVQFLFFKTILNRYKNRKNNSKNFGIYLLCTIFVLRCAKFCCIFVLLQLLTNYKRNKASFRNVHFLAHSSLSRPCTCKPPPLLGLNLYIITTKFVAKMTQNRKK